MIEFKEFGDKEKPIVMLLHGGGLNWWNYREEAELLKSKFHVVLPILDGHAGSNQPFTSIRNNASKLIDFIDSNYGGKVLLIGGLSLGAQILLEMLALRGNVCSYAFVESAAVIPSKVTRKLIGPALKCSYFLIKSRSFAKLQAKALHIKPEMIEDYYRDTCAISKNDMISFLKANTSYSLPKEACSCSAQIYVFAGSQENSKIRKSTTVLKDKIPRCTLKILMGLSHGEFSLNHAEEYVNAILSTCICES